MKINDKETDNVEIKLSSGCRLHKSKRIIPKYKRKTFQMLPNAYYQRTVCEHFDNGTPNFAMNGKGILFLKATQTQAWQSPKLRGQSESRPNECARHGRGPIQAKASARQSVSLPATLAPTHHDASNCKRDKCVVASVAKLQQELQN